MISNHSIGRCLQAIAQYEVHGPTEQFLCLSRHFEKLACLYCRRIIESGEKVYIAETSLSSLRTRSEDSQVPQPMLPAKRLQFGTDIIEECCSGIHLHIDIVYLRFATAQATINPARESARASIRPEHLFLAGVSRLKDNPCLSAAICLRSYRLGCLATLGCGLSFPVLELISHSEIQVLAAVVLIGGRRAVDEGGLPAFTHAYGHTHAAVEVVAGR